MGKILRGGKGLTCLAILTSAILQSRKIKSNYLGPRWQGMMTFWSLAMSTHVYKKAKRKMERGGKEAITWVSGSRQDR